MLLAVLMLISCAACRSSELDSTETGAATTAPSTQPTPSTTAPTMEPSIPESNEATAPSTQPTEPETPDDTNPTEPEVPTEPAGPSEPETKNEYINNENTAFPEEGLAFRPKHVYYENGQLIAECFVINAQAHAVTNVEVSLRIENAEGIIAEADFIATPMLDIGSNTYEGFVVSYIPDIAAKSHVVHTFVFPDACVLVKDAKLRELTWSSVLTWLSK
jgi:hypothetical protein